jgi:multicomponent Na+:H+ antiporter subunit B
MMSVVVKTTIRLLFPFLLVYAAYIIANGHLGPGGGFQGGVIASCAFLLLSVALGYGKASQLYDELKLSVVENLAAAAYVLIGLVGIAAAGAFLENNWLPYGSIGKLISAGFMLPLNIAIGVKVAAGTFIIGLLMLALGWEEDGID